MKKFLQFLFNGVLPKNGKNQNKPNFDQESATERLTNDIAKSFREHFQLDEKHADWKANLLIEMAESFNFIDEVMEERATRKTKRKRSSKHQILNPNALGAKVDQMQCLFTKAFAAVFNVSDDDASYHICKMFEKLGDGLFIAELINEFPVTAGDLERLGVPVFVDPEPPALESELVPEGKSLLAGLGKLPLD